MNDLLLRKKFPTGLITAALLISPISTSLHALDDVYTIVAEADTFVDQLVSIPQGGSTSLAAAYDPGFGTIARSYLRFDLPDISPVTRIVTARLNLVGTFALGGGGIVDVHRGDLDNWTENNMLWGSQPGFEAPILDSANVPGFGPTFVPVSYNLANWARFASPDLTDGKVTFVLKSRETDILPGVNFSSREGFNPPTLVLTTRERGLTGDPGMDDGSETWIPGGNAALVTDPNDPSNMVARLSTSSPASISQVVDTPHGPYGFQLRAEFLTATGTFTVLLGDDEVARFDAPEEPPRGFLVTNRALRGLNDVELKLILDGPDGVTSELILDDVSFFELPEPELTIDLVPAENEIVLSFPAEGGACYQLSRSTDLVTWTDHGRVVAPLGLTYETTLPAGETKQYFRLNIFGRCEGTDADIANWSFEEPVLGDNASVSSIPGWNNTPGSGVWNPPPAQYGGQAPEGNNVAYVHNNNSFRQTMTEVLEPFRLYRLDASLGKRTDIGWPSSSGPSLQLRAGGVTLTPVNTDNPIPAPGSFEPWSQSYIIGKEHPQLGQPLEIVVDGGVSGIVSQVNIDDFVLVVQ